MNLSSRSLIKCLSRACDVRLATHAMRVPLSSAVVPLRRTEARLRPRRLPVPLRQPRPGSELCVVEDLGRQRVCLCVSAHSKLSERRVLQLRHVHVRLTLLGLYELNFRLLDYSIGLLIEYLSRPYSITDNCLSEVALLTMSETNGYRTNRRPRFLSFDNLYSPETEKPVAYREKNLTNIKKVR